MKDCTTCKYGFVDEQFGFPMCHHPLRFSEDCIDFNMHKEKEEPKKATGTEEKKLPDELEKVAEEYLKQVKATFLRALEHPTAKECFIAGAEWMAQQGETIFAKIDVDGGERWLNEILLQGNYDCGEEVIVQIRKK